MSSIADFFINVGADIGDFKKEMQDMKKQMKTVGEDMKKVGGSLSKTITAPIVAVGAAAFAAANEFDKASNNIRAGTGATGEALDDLNNSFKEVFKDVPEDADKVSNALADLNTRTGATGKPLENMTKQFLELSRITGEDVSTSIADTTRAFEAWGVEADDMGGTMDYLWKVAQTTGIGVGELTQLVGDAGPTFRQLGIDLDEGAALLGHWEKAGIDSGAMLSGLSKAVQNMAAEGKDAATELPKLIEEIEGAGSMADANAIAMEVFGNRAGPELAEAIRSGAMSVEDLMATLDASDETISKAAADTMSLGDEFKMLKNNTMIALEPIGKILLELAKDFLPPLIETVQRLAEWFQNLSPEIQKTIMVVAAIAAAIGPLLVVAGTLISSLTALAPLFTAVKVVMLALTGPVGLVIGAVAALIAIGVLLYKNWDEVKAFGEKIWQGIQDFIAKTIEFIKNIFNTAMNWLSNKTDGSFGFIFEAIQKYLTFAKNIVTSILDFVKNTFKNAFAFLKALVTGDMAGMREAIGNQLGNIKNLFSNIFNSIVSFITGMGKTFLNAGKGLITQMVKGITGAAGKAVDAVKGVVSKVRNLLPFSPAKEGPLSDLDKLDFAGPITDSLTDGENDIRRQMEGMMQLPDIEANADLSSDYGEFDNGDSNIINFARMFDGANINVNDEDDAIDVARELYNMTTEAMRAKGVKTA